MIAKKNNYKNFWKEERLPYICKDTIDNLFKNSHKWLEINKFLGFDRNKNIPLWVWKFELDPTFSGSDVVDLAKWVIDSLIKQYQQILDKKFEILKYYFTVTLWLLTVLLTLYKMRIIIDGKIIVIELIVTFFIFILSMAYWVWYLMFWLNISNAIMNNLKRSRRILVNPNLNICDNSDCNKVGNLLQQVISDKIKERLRIYIMGSTILLVVISILFLIFIILMVIGILA